MLAAVVILGMFGASGAMAAEDIMGRILKSGTINIGVGLSGPPMGGRDASGNPIGYDVDVGNLVAGALGVKANFIECYGQNRIAMLMSDKVDIVLCNMTGNVERAKSINFSLPYIRTGIKMLVRKDSSIKQLTDLNGKNVAVGRGTTNEALVKKYAPQANLLYVDEFTSQVLLLKQGKADATLEDSSLVDFAATQEKEELVALPELYTSDPICIGTKKGDSDFLRWLDMFVSSMISSGKQAELYKKWWGTESVATYVTPW